MVLYYRLHYRYPLLDRTKRRNKVAWKIILVIYFEKSRFGATTRCNFLLDTLVFRLIANAFRVKCTEPSRRQRVNQPFQRFKMVKITPRPVISTCTTTVFTTCLPTDKISYFSNWRQKFDTRMSENVNGMCWNFSGLRLKSRGI